MRRTLTAALTAVVLTAAEPAADPAATKLLADARAARGVWNDFPGFTADVTVRSGNQTAAGTVRVAADGKVAFTGLDGETLKWAERVLGSVVGHRMPGGPDRETPCRFVDPNDADHPLGRAVQVLNDEYHSSYRIRGKEIAVVNRTMKDTRFTIAMLESVPTKEGKLLSASFVVNYWSLKTGVLEKSEGNYQGWTRVGGFDLPTELRVVTATTAKGDGGLTARSLTLSGHRLTAR